MKLFQDILSAAVIVLFMVGPAILVAYSKGY